MSENAIKNFASGFKRRPTIILCFKAFINSIPVILSVNFIPNNSWYIDIVESAIFPVG